MTGAPGDLATGWDDAADDEWVCRVLGSERADAVVVPLHAPEAVAPPRAGRARLWAADDVVAKLHAPDTDTQHLTARTALASLPQLSEVLVAPLETVPRIAPSGRALTLWPWVETVDPDDADHYPWGALGDLLARLHDEAPALAAFVGTLPPAADPRRRARRAVARVAAPSDRALLTDVLAGADRLHLGADAEAVVHGDAHLGQLGRRAGRWLLLDLDDLGVGDPVADLARPAALFAVGLLPSEDWEALLAGYRARRAHGIPDDARLWERLDRHARIALVTLTARALVTGGDPDATGRLHSACTRIAQRFGADSTP